MKKILIIASLILFFIVGEIGLGYLYFQKENNISSGWVRFLRKIEVKFNLSLCFLTYNSDLLVANTPG